MAQSRRERLAKQRERQQRVRIANTEHRKPSRDDIARALLYFAISENLKRGREAELEGIEDYVIAELVRQGFDERQSEVAWDGLVDKYWAGWSFQLKRHLSRNNDTDLSESEDEA